MARFRTASLILAIGSLVVHSYFKPPMVMTPKQSDSLVSQSEVADSKEPKPWSDLKVAIYMTTHLGTEHREFLEKCWVPSAIEKLPLLRDAHLILYTSANVKDLLKKLPFQNITIKTYKETTRSLDSRKQDGAIRAMVDAFKHEWFKNYDWVIRLNPDVLIRRDEWLRHTMLNETVDAILIEYMTGQAIHTDFAAFRPSAPQANKLIESKITNAEFHVYGAFQHLIQDGRVQWLPHAERIGGAARVVGKHSDVIHHHELVNYCPDYFNTTKDKIF